MNTVQKVLFDAACKIDTPEKWTKKAAARNAEDKPCWPHWEGKDAVSFCATGAIDCVSVSHSKGSHLRRIRIGRKAGDLLEIAMGGQMAEVVNDRKSTKHEDMMMFFALAIELAGRRI